MYLISGLDHPQDVSFSQMKSLALLVINVKVELVGSCLKSSLESPFREVFAA